MTLSLSIDHALESFDLRVAFDAPIGVTGIFGPSGSGKTSVLRIIAGLDKPNRGQLRVEDRVLFDTATGVWTPPHRRRIGFVFQEPRLFPHLSVQQNLRYGQGFGRTNRTEEARIVEMLGIDALLNRRPGTLSGGEQQRVTIGRALLTDPKILLMDEPLSALDAPRKAEILPYLERLRDEMRLPILYVSHSTSETARLSTSLVVLKNGQVQAQGQVAALMSDPDLAPFFGLRDAGALLSSTVVAHHADGLTELSCAGGAVFLPHVNAAIGDNLRVRILAHDVMLALKPPEQSSALNVLAGQVVAIKQGQGPGVLVQLAVGDDHILARITKRSALSLGLTTGTACFAVVKSVAVAHKDVGSAAER